MITPFEFWNPESGFLGGMLAGLFIIVVLSVAFKLTKWAIKDDNRINEDE